MVAVNKRDWAYFNVRKPPCPACKRQDDYVIPADWAIEPPKWYCRRCSHQWQQTMREDR